MLQLGKETTVEALGKTWRVGRLELPQIEEFVAWIKEQVGDPFKGLESVLPLLPKEEAVAMVKEAKAKRDALDCMDLSHLLVQKWQATVRGTVQLFWLMLKVNHPAVTRDEAFQVLVEVGMVKAQKAIDAGTGEVPKSRGNGQAVGPDPLTGISPTESLSILSGSSPGTSGG